MQKLDVADKLGARLLLDRVEHIAHGGVSGNNGELPALKINLGW